MFSRSPKSGYRLEGADGHRLCPPFALFNRRRFSNSYALGSPWKALFHAKMNWLLKPIQLQRQVGVVDLIRIITQPGSTGVLCTALAATGFDFDADANDGA